MDDDSVTTVIAAVIERDGKILIARRKKGMFMEQKWEFPGGKLEPGETAEACLKRELREELGIEAAIGEFIGSGTHPFSCCSTIHLLAYRATYVSGDMQLTDHDEIRWVLPSELGQYDFPQADRPILKRLMEER